MFFFQLTGTLKTGKQVVKSSKENKKTMKTIETLVDIPENRQILITFPQDVSVGKCKILIVVEEQFPKKNQIRFANYPIGIKNSNFSFRREDIYGDR